MGREEAFAMLNGSVIQFVGDSTSSRAARQLSAYLMGHPFEVRTLLPPLYINTLTCLSSLSGGPCLKPTMDRETRSLRQLPMPHPHPHPAPEGAGGGG